MTSPGQDGAIEGEIHIGPGTSEEDARRYMRNASNAAEEEAEEGGERGGRRYTAGFLRGVEAADLARALSAIISEYSRRSGETNADAFGDSFVRALPSHLRRHANNLRGDLGRTFRRVGSGAGESFVGGMMDAFGSARGLLSTITGPLAAFFNIGTRSPLILILIPIFGAIVALIVAAVYWLQALTSLLFLIPSLLLGIGIQALALGLIFNGVGEAIGTVFSADTVKEAENLLNQIKGLNTEAKKFALNLFPFKDFFSDLQQLAQTNFFGQLNLEGQLGKILTTTGPVLNQVIGNVSSALGVAVNDILSAFSSESFINALSTVGGSVAEWLTGDESGLGFGEALSRFLDGLNKFAVAIDPFLDWFGDKFNQFLADLGTNLEELSTDPEFFKWLEDAKVIIKDGIELLGVLWDWVKLLVDTFTEADKDIEGRANLGFLDTLTSLLQGFLDVISSETGQQAMKTFIVFLEVMVLLFFGLAAAITWVLAAFGYFIDLLIWLKDRFVDLKNFITEKVLKVFNDLAGLGDGLGRSLSTIGTIISDALTVVRNAITSFFENPQQFLFDAGQKIIQGLANGILAAGRNVLRPAMREIGGIISGFVPGSPAKEGPLSGSGDPFFSGKEIINRLAAGISIQSQALAGTTSNAVQNITLGPGAVSISNYGPPPTASQSRTMGSAVGQGILKQLTATNLAARTM